MKINSVLLHNCSNAVLKSNSNISFEGLFKMGKDIRRCCGLYDSDKYQQFSKEWTKKLPQNTSIAISSKNSDRFFENYTVKSLIWDKKEKVCKNCLEEEIAMDIDGIFADGHVCRYEDMETIDRNKAKLLECLNKHLDKIKQQI